MQRISIPPDSYATGKI